jgi:integrase
MPEKMSLTIDRAKAIPIPANGRTLVYDIRQPGLAVAVTSTGVRTWYVVRRGRMGMVWYRVGDVDSLGVEDARREASKAVGKILAGENPNADKRKERLAAIEKARGGKVPLIGEESALARHLAKLRERGRSKQHLDEVARVADEAYNAKASPIKDLADPKIASKADAWLRSLDISELTRHRYRAHLVAIGKTALRWWPANVLPREPFLALGGSGARLPDPAVFNPWECAQLASDEALARDGGLLWAFLLLSGCRWKEAAWARWDRIDLERSTYQVIPPDAAERAAGSRVKRDKARVVSLQPELVALLRHKQGVGFLFDEKWRNQPHANNTIAFRAHLKALGIPLEARKIHSLRHAHCCMAIACGQDSATTRLNMGHAGAEMQGHYASRAMRWRGSLIHWAGVFRLRDPVEVAKLKAWADNTPRPTDK